MFLIFIRPYLFLEISLYRAHCSNLTSLCPLNPAQRWLGSVLTFLHTIGFCRLLGHFVRDAVACHVLFLLYLEGIV